MTRQSLQGRFLVLAGIVACAWLGVSRTAHADEPEYNFDKSTWPIQLVARPLVLAPGLLEINGDTAIIGMSSGSVGDPIRLAPDAYYGISRKIMIGVDHTRGVCVVGDACGARYNDVALNLVYSIMHGGNLHLAALLGASAPTLDPLSGGVNLGFLAKARLGVLAVQTGAMLYVGILERDANNPESEQYVRIPFQIQIQAQRQLAFLVDFGFNGPLDGFASNSRIPAGFGALFTLNSRLDLGASFFLDDLSDDAGRFDNRTLYVRANVRL